MAKISGQVSANTGNAKQEVQQLSEKLKELHQQAKLFDGGGISLMGPKALQDLSGAVEVLTRAAGSFEKINFGASNLPVQMTQALTQAQHNLDNYLRDLERKLPAHAKTIRLAIASSGNPLLPDWSRLTSNQSGLNPAQQNAAAAHAQSQMRDYYSHVFSGLQWRNQMGFGGNGFDGGPTGGSVADFLRNQRSASDIERERIQQEQISEDNQAGGARGGSTLALLGGAGRMGMGGLAKLGALGAGLAGVGSAASMATQGYGLLKSESEPLDKLLRSVKDTGDGLKGFEHHLYAAGRALGQTGEQALETAMTYAKASMAMDQHAIETGYATSTGFARAFGVDAERAGAQFGELKRFGVTGTSKSDEREFASTLAAAIQQGGYGANAGGLIDELIAHVEQRAGNTGRASSDEAANYLAMRAAMGSHDVLRGSQGVNLLGQIDSFTRQSGSLGTEMMWANALRRGGINNPYQQEYMRQLGPMTDLSAVGGQSGVTALQLYMDEVDQQTRGLGPWQKKIMRSKSFGSISAPMMDELFGLRAKHGAGMFNAQMGAVGSTGVDLSDMNLSALKEVFEIGAMGTKELKGYAAKRLQSGAGMDDMQSTGLAKALAMANGSPTAENIKILRDMLTQISAQNGQQDTMATSFRQMESSLDAVKRTMGGPLVTGVLATSSTAHDIHAFMKERWGKGEKNQMGMPIENHYSQPDWLQRLRGVGAYAPQEYPTSSTRGHQAQPRPSGGAPISGATGPLSLPIAPYVDPVRAALGLGGGVSGPMSPINDSGIPAEGRALLEAIAGPESGGRYNVRFDGTADGATFSGYANHPRIYERIPAGFAAAGKLSSAAGKYQFVASTWDDIAPLAGVTDFSPASQDKAAWTLAQRDYKKNTGRDLLSDLRAGDTSHVRGALSGTWEALGRMGDAGFERLLSEQQAKDAQGGGLEYKGGQKTSYVDGIDKFMEVEGSRVSRDASNFGSLNLTIDQRVNGITQRTQQQRLRAGSGTRQNEMHGVVDMGSVA